ncbi:hypothetical protein AAC387_Pa07g2254 [Persea americana]
MVSPRRPTIFSKNRVDDSLLSLVAATENRLRCCSAAGNRTQLTCTLQDDRWRRCLTVRRHVSSDVCRRRSGAAPLCSVCKPRDKMW